MKLNIKNIAVLVACLIGASSCDKFLDVNDNPNKPVSENLTLAAKLPATLLSTARQEALQYNQLGSLWAGYWGTTSEGVNMFFKEKNYDGPAIRHIRDGIPAWENGYSNLNEYELIKQQAIKENRSFYEGVVKIMQGYQFLRLVDMYNNIPFDQALKGSAAIQPSYNTGSEVYQKSMDLISEGIADLKNTVAGTEAGSDDIIFKGNKTKWIQFANTIKLRALIRQSEVGADTYIRAELAKIVAEGSGFVTEDVLVQPGFLATVGKMNPFWESNYRNANNVETANYLDIRPTQFILDFMDDRQDPRLEQLYVAKNGDYVGVLFGNPNAEVAYNRAHTSEFKGPNENNSVPGGIFKTAISPLVLMLSAESYFLQAEAIERGWMTGNAKLAYENGIQASFAYFGVPSSTFSAYNSQASVDYDQASQKIQRIVEQKWLALNSVNGIEAWSEFRRLGHPAIPNSLMASSTSVYPLRLMYPESERQSNGAHAAQQGNDEVTVSKVWWQK